MADAILVNFHTHSLFSDGEQAPEALAANLSAAGVRYAALTDHDTLEGLPRFKDALRKRGIVFLPGVELTTRFAGRDAHILGYGFDPEHSELAATLSSLRQVRGVDVHSIAGSMRRAGASRGADAGGAASAAPDGVLDAGEAIALIHRAGGLAFLAHPLTLEPDPARLAGWLEDLKSKGLDGIEAIYASYPPAAQANLRQLARQFQLLVCAGTDFHGSNGPGSPDVAIEMPREDWDAFRAALFAGSALVAAGARDGPSPSTPAATESTRPAKPHRFRRRSYVLRIALPTLAAITLFLIALWGVILPAFERSLLERKRETIRELTNSAWSILASHERDVQSGRLSRDQAQAMASALIQDMRYGPEGKDYFWIQDAQPRMVMHPYRAELNGQELGSFTDSRGVAIFAEFARLVQREGEGYIDYVWQWKDDPARLEPKESFVKGFAPWGWIIGTGLYIDDVRQEIARIEQSVILAALAIFGAIVLLLLYVLQQSLRVERERQDLVDSLHLSTERYHTLVEAATEGMLLVLDDRCRYANPTFLDMLGYTPRQLEFLELADVLPRVDANAEVWQGVQPADGVRNGSGAVVEGRLARSDGTLLDRMLTLNPIVFDGQAGYILLARDAVGRATGTHVDAPADAGQSALIEDLQASLLHLHEPIALLARDGVACGLDASVEQVARLMTARDASAVLVVSNTGAGVGIVTDHDLRARVLGSAVELSTPIHAVMSAPLRRISEHARVYEALLRMEEHGVRHLALEAQDGRIVGIVDAAALLSYPRYGPLALLREIARAHSPDEVARCCGRSLPFARSLLDSSARSRHVTRMLTSVCDAATQRLIELAAAELGPPPARFAFIAMGSQGRQELTLLTDQDNGIVYAPGGTGDPLAIHEYFLNLGARVRDGLSLSGYAPCRGQVMASNPRWCHALPEWLTGFEAWVRAAEPQEIADLSITLDFRPVYGDAELAHDMRRRIHALLHDQPAFFLPFAQNTLTFKPPVRLLGSIYLGGDAEHAGEIDLKDALMPLVSFARLYALRHQVNETSTLARMDELVATGELSPASRDEFVIVYEFLMQLRLRNQLAEIEAGRPARNGVHPSALGHIEKELLKQAFAQISALQKKIGYDFPGAI